MILFDMINPEKSRDYIFQNRDRDLSSIPVSQDFLQYLTNFTFFLMFHNLDFFATLDILTILTTETI